MNEGEREGVREMEQESEGAKEREQKRGGVQSCHSDVCVLGLEAVKVLKHL